MSKIYIYQDKNDHRFRYIKIDDNGNRINGSYPRLLMEEKLGRPLELNEDVHHINGDVTDNRLSNLEIVLHGEHQKHHSTKYIDTIEKCQICGKRFTMRANKWTRFFSDLSRTTRTNRYITCSKSCAAKLGSGKYKSLYQVKDRLAELDRIWLK